MTLKQKKRLYKEAQAAYYKGLPIMTDSEFDKLEESIQREDPTWKGLKTPGSEKIVKKRKVKLEWFMPSLGKAYPHQIDKWMAKRKGPWIVMSKLDGSSVQANYERGKLVSVVTRGNGTVGQDITFLSPWLALPKTIPTKKKVGIRFEAIMEIRVFEKKYAGAAENPRNLVAGLLNRKLGEEDPRALKDIHFIALGLYGQPMEKGLDLLTRWNFSVVSYEFGGPKMGLPHLSSTLALRRNSGPYEMDGLVIVPARQKMIYENADKPDWAIAFKENLEDHEAPETEVLDVVWQISHARRWTPKVQIRPVRLDGVTVNYATAHNARWLFDQKIGKGAVIRVVRSGGVIPKIVKVVKPGRPCRPEGEVEWRGRYLYAVEDSEESAAKNITRFLSTCGVENVKLKTVEKMGLKSIEAVAKFSSLPEEKQRRDLGGRGFGAKQAEIIIEQLQVLQRGVSLVQVMVGSGVFSMGIGERRLNSLAQAFPLSCLLQESRAKLRSRVLAVHGFKDKTFDELWAGLQEFRVLFASLSNTMKIDVPKKAVAAKKPKEGVLNGKAASWTGYRSKEQESEWEARGGQVVPFGAKTQILFYREGGKPSSKVEKAQVRGIQVTTWPQK